MINDLLNNQYYVSVLSDNEYKNFIKDLEKQVVGKSKYENCAMIEYLPKGKEFYVFCDKESSYDVVMEWDFRIVTTYKGIPFMIIDCGSN